VHPLAAQSSTSQPASKRGRTAPPGAAPSPLVDRPPFPPVARPGARSLGPLDGPPRRHQARSVTTPSVAHSPDDEHAVRRLERRRAHSAEPEPPTWTAGPRPRRPSLRAPNERCVAVRAAAMIRRREESARRAPPFATPEHDRERRARRSRSLGRRAEKTLPRHAPAQTPEGAGSPRETARASSTRRRHPFRAVGNPVTRNPSRSACEAHAAARDSGVEPSVRPAPNLSVT